AGRRCGLSDRGSPQQVGPVRHRAAGGRHRTGGAAPPLRRRCSGPADQRPDGEERGAPLAGAGRIDRGLPHADPHAPGQRRGPGCTVRASGACGCTGPVRHPGRHRPSDVHAVRQSGTAQDVAALPRAAPARGPGVGLDAHQVAGASSLGI
ncbi:uncharacterized protein METZ01_LOCUS237226, partial [marine metagenome]